MKSKLLTNLVRLSAFLLFLVPFQANAFKLLSHRAVYDLSLMPGGDGKISHVDGRLVIEWVDTCEGYTTEQRMLMRMGIENKLVDNDFQFSSWESKDGDHFRYDVKTTFADGEPEVFQGEARRGEGVATFTRPADLKMTLPDKTVFPSEHMARLVEHASAGERQISMRMFDGTGKEGLLDAAAFVLGKAPVKRSTLLGSSGDVPGWRLQLSFFDMNNRDQLPLYKVKFTLFSNGISDDIVLDYSDFAVRGTLSDFTVLPVTGC